MDTFLRQPTASDPWAETQREILSCFFFFVKIIKKKPQKNPIFSQARERNVSSQTRNRRQGWEHWLTLSVCEDRSKCDPWGSERFFLLSRYFTGENTVPAGSVATVTQSINNAETKGHREWDGDVRRREDRAGVFLFRISEGAVSLTVSEQMKVNHVYLQIQNLYVSTICNILQETKLMMT